MPTDQHIARMYGEGLSTRQIAERTGLPRRQVTAALERRAVPRPARGRGRPRPQMRKPVPDGIADVLREFYLDRRLTRAQIAAELGQPEHRVRSWMSALAIPTRSRGPHNRQDRHLPDAGQLQMRYVQQRQSGRDIAAALTAGTNRVFTALHDYGLPVRAGGNAGPDSAVSVIDALYADALVLDALARHGVPVVPAGRPLTQRFPLPQPLEPGLLHELYVACGLSTTHIELLTGQPTSAIRRALARNGIPLRGPGQRSPFTRRLGRKRTSR